MSEATTPGRARSVQLDVPVLARVEGEGGMHVKVRAGQVTDVELRIFEPPRFFEAMLRGRAHTEPPDITARICGICPVAYQLTAAGAIEQACGVEVTAPIQAMRRLLYCGEWIESHVLHIYLLHAPDFLGYPDAITMAADHREAVERGLRLKKAGNDLMALVGGRSVHPVNVKVGGFYRFPTRAQLRAAVPMLEQGLADALATVELVAGFGFPDFEQTAPYVSTRTDGPIGAGVGGAAGAPAWAGYPIDGGHVVSTTGLSFPAAHFDHHIVELHVPHSNALHARLHGSGPYLVGPLARYALNHDRLSATAAAAAGAAGLGPVCRNPFQSIVVRAVEVVEAFVEALRIVQTWLDDGDPGPASVPVPPRAGTGHAVTEAPRGLIYHRYTLNGDGTIADARITPPTSQNQASIEHDLREFVQSRLHLNKTDLVHQCEQAIRNYDPCISCATHFLDLTVHEVDEPTGGGGETAGDQPGPR